MVVFRYLTGIFLSLVFVSTVAVAQAKAPKLVKKHKLCDASYPNFKLIDLDGDKDLDILVWGEKQVQVLVNKKKKFKPQFIHKIWKPKLAVADMDGDGDPDLVIGTHKQEYTLAWLENLGKAKAWKTHIIDKETNREGVAVGDVDGDGDPDIITLQGNSLELHQNKGKAKSWESPYPVHNAKYIKMFHLADLDGDKDLDMYTVEGYSVNCTWLKNDGSGTDFKGTLIKKCPGAMKMIAADFDGDKDLDLVNGGDELLYFENVDGKGSFGNEVVATKLNSGVYPTAADVDGDGDLDIGTIDRSVPGQIAWHENDDGEFGERKTLTERMDLAKFRGVSAADMDGDGDVDFVFATDSNVLMWENGAKR